MWKSNTSSYLIFSLAKSLEKVIIPLENVCLIYKFPLLKSFEASPSFGDIVTGCVEYLKHDIHSVVCMKKKLIINKTNFFLS